LKRARPEREADESQVPPGLTAGGGLKPILPRWGVCLTGVPPGLTAGGGLKLPVSTAGDSRWVFPPASPPGAD